MAEMIRVTGTREVIRKLRRAGGLRGFQVEAGLKRAGLFLLRKSKEIVPVDTSNLKGGGDVKALGRGYNTDVMVFYTALYAVYVHERTDLRHAPGKEAKFLEKPAREHRETILKIVAASASNARMRGGLG